MVGDGDRGSRWGLLVTGRPVLTLLWGRCCDRVGLVATTSDPGTEHVIAVVLVDAASPAARTWSAPIVLLVDDAPSSGLIEAHAGAVRAVVTWRDGERELEVALRAVLGGGSHISATAAPGVLSVLSRLADHTASRVQLTKREVDVMNALVDGATIRSTGRALGIGVKTVEAHRASAYVKLGVRTHGEAITRLLSDPTILEPAGE